MVYFFYGADSYRLRQKVKSVIDGYQTKHKSGLNLARFDFDKAGSFDKFKNFVESVSMFSEKKLAIIENLFFGQKDEVEKFTDYLRKGAILKDQERFVVIEQELEKNEERKSEQKYILKDAKDLFKKLTGKEVKNEEFDWLSGIKLENWIKDKVATSESKIDQATIKKLAAFVGADLWQMAGEIDKLAAYKKEGIINEKDVDELVKSKLESNIFNTIDALAARNKKTALDLLHRHLAEGESEIYLLTMLVYQFRNLLLVKSEMERGTQFQSLGKTIKLHPFVLRKSFEQSKGFTLSVLKRIYERLLELDMSIKSGRIEPQVALDLVVGEITG
jgi:DNA polymerase-3 subunit delta